MKSLVKALAEAAAWVAVLPVWALYGILLPMTGRHRALQAVFQRAARWPGEGGNVLRRAIARHLLAHVGHNVTISFGAMVTKPTAELGNNVYIGLYTILGDVRIGDDAMISDHVLMPSGRAQHRTDRLDIPVSRQPGEFRTITIGCDAWIGTNAVVLDDVGNHCVVGAGSVVTKPVPDYAVVVGNPARQIGDRRERAASVSGAAGAGTAQS